jgi:hypothetical protein
LQEAHRFHFDAMWAAVSVSHKTITTAKTWLLIWCQISSDTGITSSF